MTRYAVLSMDIEDWFHVDYFDRSTCDLSYSMLDGLDVYLELMDELNVLSSFFCLGELAESLKSRLREMSDYGHEIGSHTSSHRRPLLLSLPDVREELRTSKDSLEQVVSSPVEGFRAPCFSFDRSCLDFLSELGYHYDTSRINFEMNPRYGSIDMEGFERYSKNIFIRDDFFEFQMSTQRFLFQNFPVSGGGYLRMFPWMLTASLLKKFLRDNELYTLYVHPYELSTKKSPPFPKDTSFVNKKRFGVGRTTVKRKITDLVKILQENNFTFMTFTKLRQKILQERNTVVQ